MTTTYVSRKCRCWKCKNLVSVRYIWRVCADGPDRKICDDCDAELNRMALQWAYPKTWKRQLEAYKKRTGA